MNGALEFQLRGLLEAIENVIRLADEPLDEWLGDNTRRPAAYWWAIVAAFYVQQISGPLGLVGKVPIRRHTIGLRNRLARNPERISHIVTYLTFVDEYGRLRDEVLGYLTTLSQP